MHAMTEALRWLADATPSPTPMPSHGPGPGIFDGIDKFIGSLTNLIVAVGSLVGAWVAVVSARQLRQLKQQNTPQPPNPPSNGPGGTP